MGLFPVRQPLPMSNTQSPLQFAGYWVNLADRYKILGSAGQSEWTHTPWVALLDPAGATSVQEGIYVVHLLSLGCERLDLSLNQGCTTLHNSAGCRKVKRGRTEDLHQTIIEDLKDTDLDCEFEKNYRQFFRSPG